MFCCSEYCVEFGFILDDNSAVIIIVVVVVVDHCAMTPGDLRSLQRRQRNSVGILLDIVEPDVARAARQSSPAGHWLSAFVGIHHQKHSIVCWYSRVQAFNMTNQR